MGELYTKLQIRKNIITESVTVQTLRVELGESSLIAVSLSVSNGDSPPIFALQVLGSPPD